jgi:DNA-binding response OmpR family regulator
MVTIEYSNPSSVNVVHTADAATRAPVTAPTSPASNNPVASADRTISRVAHSLLGMRRGMALNLMRRAGRTCSRGELLADVWGLTFDPGSNVVDVYIRRLRGKLDRPNRIETVRNVGYAFALD